MRDSGRRVVLLARPGAARERLRSALTEVGAELAFEADPTQVDVDELTAARPEVVIVALDNVSEPVIDRLDAVLLDPAVDVLFEEADVAASRSGWDAARWVRHLAAKLNRHGDVLPPGASTDRFASTVGAQPAVAMDAMAMDDVAMDEAGSGEALSAPAEPVPAHPLSEEFTPGVEAGSYGGFDPVAAEMSDIEQNADQVIVFDAQLRDDFALDVPSESGASGLPSLDLVFESEIALPADEATAASTGGVFQFGDLSLDDLRGDTALPPALTGPGHDFDVAGTVPVETAVPAFVAPGTDLDIASAESAMAPSAMAPLAGPDSGFDVAAPGPVAAASAAAFARSDLDFDIAGPQPAVQPAAPTFAGVSGGHVLELVTDDAPMTPVASQTSAGLRPNLDDIERRIASLELVDDRPPAAAAATPAGALLLVAGIGGPDAVRQLLGALPEGFPRPVVVRQRLDGGRYDRLVSQMQRATQLPVDLAEPGSALRPGVVYVLPSDVGIASGADGLCFDGSTNTFETLPPGDSAVVLLSGCDAALADALSSPEWTDAFVAGQAAEGCYDPAASNALAARGRSTAQPAELAQRLAERWSAE